MFQTLGYFIVAVVGLAVFAAVLPLALHWLYGPDPPPRIARLIDTCIDVFKLGAESIFGLLKIGRKKQADPPAKQ